MQNCTLKHWHLAHTDLWTQNEFISKLDKCRNLVTRPCNLRHSLFLILEAMVTDYATIVAFEWQESDQLYLQNWLFEKTTDDDFKPHFVLCTCSWEKVLMFYNTLHRELTRMDAGVTHAWWDSCTVKPVKPPPRPTPPLMHVSDQNIFDFLCVIIVNSFHDQNT